MAWLILANSRDDEGTWERCGGCGCWFWRDGEEESATAGQDVIYCPSCGEFLSEDVLLNQPPETDGAALETLAGIEREARALYEKSLIAMYDKANEAKAIRDLREELLEGIAPNVVQAFRRMFLKVSDGEV